MKYWLIIPVFMLCTVTWAQEDVEISAYAKNAADSLRAHYIRPYSDYFFLWPVIKQRRLDFELERLSGDERTVSFQTNKPYSLGIGMYLFELGIEIAFAIPLDEEDQYIYGESDATDLQLNILGKKWGGDAFYQKYRGFYMDDPAINVPPNTPYPHRSDIETRNVGISVNYTFNYNKFSFRSAYSYVERQLRSAGSIILFGTVSGFRASGDSAILGTAYSKDFGSDALIREIKTTSLGLAPGYTYSLIYRGFFLNGTLALGPSHNWTTFSVEDGPDQHDIRFSAYVVGRIGIGYNGDKVFGGISFMSQTRTARFETVKLNSSNDLFKILIGFRFQEFGVLKKRIWDLPKEFL
jgi:hypothetical protein